MPAGGVAVLAGGVAVPAGGVAVLAGGVAVPAGGVADRGAELCPADPAGADPPAGALCATAQAAHKRITESKLAFFTDISCPPNLNLDLKKSPISKSSSEIHLSLDAALGRSYPADAVGDGTKACTNQS